MAQRGRNDLKNIWITGATITESMFDDAWDSFYNIIDDVNNPLEPV